MRIIGRDEQYTQLLDIYNSGKPELVVVKGRRRVGKTYLINNAFNNDFAFKYTGISPIEMEDGGNSKLNRQLDAFYIALKRYGYVGKKPVDWLEAFSVLEQLLEIKGDETRQVVFIDELPWMDTPKSDFVSSFEHFWNDWGSTRQNLMLIVCGSSNSWMNDNLLMNYGGLYNRVTRIIDLYPFTLKETGELLRFNQVILSDYDVVQSYMIFGGIPFYLNLIDRNLSLAQNIDKLFFAKNAVLRNEFDQLFKSAFKRPDEVKNIVTALSKNRIGLTQKEISDRCKISGGGTLSRLLKSLVASNFIVEYVPFGRKKNERYFKLIDRFCLFYLYFVSDRVGLDRTFWQDNLLSQTVSAWRGFAFEQVCFDHINEIKNSLKIGGLSTKISGLCYAADNDKPGGQIDMIIVRADNIVDMCEMKFYGNDYVVTQNDVKKMKDRETFLANNISKRHAIHHVLITTFGVKKNEYSDYYRSVITISDLLR